MATLIGEPVECDLTRSEDDTDDLTVRLKDSTGALVDTTGWTGTFSIAPGKDDAATATFSGTAPVTPTQPNGLIVFDMDTFAVPIGNYKYDIRLIDGSVGDSPARVYFKGSQKVTARIN